MTRISWLDFWLIELEDMKLDLKAGLEDVATLGEAREDCLVHAAGYTRYLLAVVEMHIAQHPSRLRRPRQNSEGGWIRHHQRFGRALYFAHAKSAALREYRKHGAVRGVFG